MSERKLSSVRRDLSSMRGGKLDQWIKKVRDEYREKNNGNMLNRERKLNGIIPFGDLTEDEREKIAKNANWRVNGGVGSWNAIVDSRYGVIQHVVIANDGDLKFDKVNIQWTPGVFIVPVRVNPEKKKVEFLIPREKRILLRDACGVQGNVYVENIPQGLIEVNESSTDAARREIGEETGIRDVQLIHLGNIAFDVANSESRMPFFLAIIPYGSEKGEQELEETEDISLDQGWQTYAEVMSKEKIDGKTIIGLALARNVLNPNLL